MLARQEFFERFGDEIVCNPFAMARTQRKETGPTLETGREAAVRPGGPVKPPWLWNFT